LLRLDARGSPAYRCGVLAHVNSGNIAPGPHGVEHRHRRPPRLWSDKRGHLPTQPPQWHKPNRATGPWSILDLTALLPQPRRFQTSSIAVPASRFLREHLHQSVFFSACIPRISAQVPVVTTGKLTHTLRQRIPCGIDIAIMAAAAFWARPLPLIEPQLIESEPAYRAVLARGIPRAPAGADVLKPKALAAALGLETGIARTPRKEAAESAVLIPQALRQGRRQHLVQPLMPRRPLPLRQPSREIVAREG